MKHRLVAASFALIAACTLGPSHASGAPGQTLYYTAGVAADTVNYTVPDFAMRQSDSLTFVNIDRAQHDVIAGTFGHPQLGPDRPWCANFFYTPGHCPLFQSFLRGTAQTSPVFGLDGTIPAGTYTFFCSIHNNMHGTLVVVAG